MLFLPSRNVIALPVSVFAVYKLIRLFKSYGFCILRLTNLFYDCIIREI